MKRVLVFGDRHYKNADRIRKKLQSIGIDSIEVLIEGECDGADKLSAAVAKELGLPDYKIRRFPAKWGLYGRAAGPLRNAQMIKEGRPNLALAFHDDISSSVGTRSMIKQIEKAGIELWCSWKEGE